MGITLFGCGNSHDFDTIFAAGTTAFNAMFDATAAAVARIFAQRSGRQLNQYPPK